VDKALYDTNIKGGATGELLPFS